jgi:hypothetical protein
MKFGKLKFYLYLPLILMHSPQSQAAESTSSLPPNWNASKPARLQLMPRWAPPPPPKHASERQDPPELAVPPTSIIGLTGGSPELLGLDFLYKPNRWFAGEFSLAPSWPFDITVEMPSDVVQSDKSNTLAAAYTAFDANFKAHWGPHAQLASRWFIFGGAWYIGGGMGYRQLSITGEAESSLRICTIAEAKKEPPCANDKAALQTRNHLRVEADVKITSVTAAAETGWLWLVGAHQHFGIGFNVGAFKAVKNTFNSSATAELVAPDGTSQEVSGALEELKLKAERDIADKAETELRPFTEKVLPIAHLGLYYAF